LILPLRLVLDTNVIISAFLWGGRPLELVRASSSGQAELFTSDPLVAELTASLLKPRLARQVQASGLTAAEHVANYRNIRTVVEPAILPAAVSRDPDDDQVLACALAAEADAVVSGDDDLLVLKGYAGIAILQVGEAVELIAALAGRRE
jgi:uncharacterized protein